jgi:pyruvate-ferredoxin/flavodoxin oxidoreductase
LPLKKYVYNETRYTMLAQSDPAAAATLLEEAQQDIQNRRKLYDHLAALPGAPAEEVSQ